MTGEIQHPLLQILTASQSLKGQQNWQSTGVLVDQIEADAAKLEAEASKIRAKAERSCDTATGGGNSEYSGEKCAPISRPVIEEISTESDWLFFLTEWGRYMETTGIMGESAIWHLWKAC